MVTLTNERMKLMDGKRLKEIMRLLFVALTKERVKLMLVTLKKGE